MQGQTLLYFQKITHYFVDFMCFIYVNYKDVFKVFLVHATRIVAPAKQSTVSEAKPSAEDERQRSAESLFGAKLQVAQQIIINKYCLF